MPVRAPIFRPFVRERGEQFRAEKRGSAHGRGYSSAWRRYARTFLATHPLCAVCLTHGLTKPSTLVDHIAPFKGDERLLWDPNNHQALCRSCHAIKTAKETSQSKQPA